MVSHESFKEYFFLSLDLSLQDNMLNDLCLQYKSLHISSLTIMKGFVQDQGVSNAGPRKYIFYYTKF